MAASPDDSGTGKRYAARAVEDTLLELLHGGPRSSRRHLVLTGEPGNGMRTLLLHRLPARLGERAQVLSADGGLLDPRGDRVLLVPDPARLHALQREQLDRSQLVVGGGLDGLPSWLHSARQVEIVRVPALALAELTDFLRCILDGDIELTAAGKLGRAAGFVPGILTVLVRALLSSGGLVHSGSRWRLAGSLTGDLITPQVSLWIADLRPNEVEILQQLSLEGALDEEALPPGEVSVLLRRGFVHRASPGLIEVRAPIMSAAIRHLIPPEIAARSYRASLEGERHSAGAVRWAYAHGRSVAADHLFSVVAELRQSHDWEAGITLIELALPTAAPGTKVALLLELAHAWRFQGSMLEAEAALVRAQEVAATTEEGVDTDQLRAAIAIARADLAHYGRGDLDEALESLETLEHAISSELSRGMLTAQRLLHLAYGGRYAEFLTAYEDALTRRRLAHASRDDRARVGVASCLALIAVGSPKRGYVRALRLKSESTLLREESTWLMDELHAVMFGCGIYTTGPAQLRAVAQTLDMPVTAETPPTENLVFDLARATWFLTLGDIPRAVAVADQAVAAVELYDPSGFAASLNALRAYLSALGGDADRARILLREQPGIPLRSSGSVGGELQANLAAVAFLLGDSRATVALLAQANEFADAGLYGFAAELLHVGVRFGKRQAARRLLELAPRLDGALYEARVAQAAAILDQDPLALSRVAGTFQELGFPLFAAECYGRLITMRDAPERVRRAAEREGTRLAASIGAPGHPLVQRLARIPETSLTAREEQIGELIHAGLSNAEIATRLHLSPRTVEGHITRLYRKTGDGRRPPTRLLRQPE